MATSYPNEAYQVGWICALHIERAAAEAMLDEKHGHPLSQLSKSDANSYVLGRMHEHNVVIACLPLGEVGPGSTAVCASHLMSSFPNIRIGLLVGIGAGLPSHGQTQTQPRRGTAPSQQQHRNAQQTKMKGTQGPIAISRGTTKPRPISIAEKPMARRPAPPSRPTGSLPSRQPVRAGAGRVAASNPPDRLSKRFEEDVTDEVVDIRLGYVVISSDKSTGGLVAYNFGERSGDGSFEVAYHLDQPPRVLRSAVGSLRGAHELDKSRVPDYLATMLRRIAEEKRDVWKHPGQNRDVLFRATYTHQGRGRVCTQCDQQQTVQRKPRNSTDPVIHYGVIATGTEVVKHAPTRDEVRDKHNAICLEMEAAGLMSTFPCVVIRGISDYADSHKNDDWHRYAAASAAACAKELLLHVHPMDVHESQKAAEAVEEHLLRLESKVESWRTSSQEKELRRWLSAPDYESSYLQPTSQYHEATCLWFVEGDAFRSWLKGAGSYRHLWLRGIPGLGKTILSARVISMLEMEQSSTPLFFFFDVNDKKKQTLESLLRSLLLQLYERSEQARLLHETIFSERFGEGNRRLSLRELASMVLELVRAGGRGYKVVVDALDECSTREEFFTWAQTFTPAASNVSFLITSRDERAIELGMKTWLFETSFVTLDSELVTRDIATYVHYRLNSDRSFEKWRQHPGIMSKMQNTIETKAHGMFRLATCQLEMLRACIDSDQVDDELEALPATLEGMYKRILEAIDTRHRSRVIRILQMLVYGQRPLRLEEIVDAVATDPRKTPAFHVGCRMPDPHSVLEVSPSLVRTRRSRGPSAESVRDEDERVVEVVELSHATVKDYLMSLGHESVYHPIADSIFSH